MCPNNERKTLARNAQMTPKERILAAIRRKPVDYTPCVPFFMQNNPQQLVGYRYQFPWGPSEWAKIDYCINELGVDQCISVQTGDFCPADGVSSKVWKEGGIIHKVWNTPSGDLHASVRYNEKWPHGLDIPFISDFNIGHFVEPWLKSHADLECLKHILLPARTKEQIDRIRFNYEAAAITAGMYGIAILTVIGFGLTAALTMCGSTELCMLTVDDPELVDGFLELEHQANLRHIEIAIDMGVDIIQRDGFYETADFFSPAMLQKFLAKRINKEADMIHQAGKVLTYTVNTGVMPILDHLDSLDIDCVDKFDTAFRDVDLLKINNKLGGKKSFWTGPSSAYHIWGNDTEAVRKSVREVFEVFGNTGLIISACPSSHSIMPWENTIAMIDEWKKLR